MASSDRAQLRKIGSQLGQYVRQQGGNPPSAGALQGVVADLAAKMPDLQAPLRDLVTRQTFQTLLPHALSAGGSVRRDALIQEISRVYSADVLLEIEEVLNGFLDATGGIAFSKEHTRTTPGKRQSAQELKNTIKTINISRPAREKTGSPEVSLKLKQVAGGVLSIFFWLQLSHMLLYLYHSIWWKWISSPFPKAASIFVLFEAVTVALYCGGIKLLYPWRPGLTSWLTPSSKMYSIFIVIGVLLGLVV